MKRLYSLTVPGEPLGKGRPRVTRNGTFTPKATRDAEARIQGLARHAWPLVQPHPGPWVLVVEFHRVHRHRRDVDNLAKLVMDALSGILWEDDYQVHSLTASMHFHPKGAQAHTAIQAYRTEETTA